ncbi:sigma-70 family RNA polymerase sigma factor [Pseudonocardiaceae bacterium YIM PH 21723]|nr:sigma-70 family RNA polymerase sigma factor [Pseudonocardiaceae bacterium YIM PH 21723]
MQVVQTMTEDTEPVRPDPISDPAAFIGALFDAHAGQLRRYVARRIGAQHADDIVGETFLIAYQQLNTFDPARGQARAWLFGIATNLIRKQVRDEMRDYRMTAKAVNVQSQQSEGPDANIPDRVDAEAAVRRLASGLSTLAPGDRDVLLLTSWGELDSNEVAAALDIPVGTVRSRLHRVRKWLRRHGSAQVGESNE